MTFSTEHTMIGSGATSIPAYFNIGSACTEPHVRGLADDQPAIIIDQGELGSASLSYADLAEQTNRFGHALSALKLEARERVLLWLPNCVEFPIAFFGTLKIGAIAVPSSMLLTGEEIDYLAKDSGAKILVTTTKLWHRFAAFTPHSHHLEHIILVDLASLVITTSVPTVTPRLLSFSALLAEHEPDPIRPDTKASDPAYLVYTSGTTGYPKGVLHAHRALLGRQPAAHHWFDYQEQGDRILHSGKFNWTYVLGTALMDPLFLGKTVIVYEGDSDVATWPKLIAKYQCTIFIGVPTIYRQIVQKTTFSGQDLPSLRHCMCAGEHLSDELLSAWQQRFGLAIYEAIGMSECSYYLSQDTEHPLRPGSVGRPQPGHAIALLDEQMQPVADEQEGMLCIGLDDPGLFIEYWDQVEITQETRRQGYFLTGDYARRDTDGYYWFLGRKDDLINSFGFRISPLEIERVIKTHPHVADCVALEEIAELDKHLVVICVIVKPGQILNETQLISFAKQHLAKYKVPKKVYFFDEFPRTINGKIIRKQLRAR